MNTFRFKADVVVQEIHVNYRQHVSYDKYFVFFQEACLHYLAMFGYRFDDTDEFGVIAADARCVFKKELFQGDAITIGCRIRSMKPKAFEMEYKIVRGGDICATGETTYLCFDYTKNTVAPFPDWFVGRVKTHEGMP
jgi:acyl-CoA thioesterase FadM